MCHEGFPESCLFPDTLDLVTAPTGLKGADWVPKKLKIVKTAWCDTHQQKRLAFTCRTAHGMSFSIDWRETCFASGVHWNCGKTSLVSLGPHAISIRRAPKTKHAWGPRSSIGAHTSSLHSRYGLRDGFNTMREDKVKVKQAHDASTRFQQTTPISIHENVCGYDEAGFLS